MINFAEISKQELEKAKRIKKLSFKMKAISVFPDITKFADFPCKNADVSRTQSCVT